VTRGRRAAAQLAVAAALATSALATSAFAPAAFAAAEPPPWEIWRDLSRLARLTPGDQVLLRSSHCPSQCRFDRTSAGDTRFLRLEGGEAVIFDEPGAGAITRIWMTMGDGQSLPLDARVRLRIRIDGESAPRVDLALPELFSGNHPPFLAPLVLDLFDSSGGNVSYVPIPYRRGCKVSLVGAEAARIWYQIGFHRLASAQGVESFRADDDLAELRRLLESAGTDPWPQPHAHALSGQLSIAEGEERLVWERQGAGELRRLRLRLARADWPRLRLLADFDGSRRVDLPLADFFAAGRESGDPARSLLVGADLGGALYAYFPMPFVRDARIALRSVAPSGGGAVLVDTDLGWSEETPAADSAAFFAEARALDTADPERDLTLLSRSGAGKWVGLFLELSSIGTAARDYLEGDERAYVDGATSPSIYGTGVEDFFNGGFFFDRGTVLAALHGSTYQIRAPEGESVDGMYRLLLADAVPFHGSLRVALENGPGPPTGHLRMRGRAVAWGYGRDDAPWQLVDRLDVASARSRRDHAYQPPRRARCAQLTAEYESDPPQARTALGCSFASGKSTFTVRSPRPGALRLRRLLDAGAGAPEAEVLVAGKRAAIFPYVAANPYRRWQELDVDLPLPGGGALAITVVPRPEPGGAVTHNEFAYELWQAP
jgi:D-arabinan exo alpha-(1,3)/(1,5)-arabinofuranosidase (non-reducing end)